ncbi:DUF397 domain-containing protein [Actinocorallia sp. API 0066]|nr:DUF397 domain-containing protein [Actinocorallia sp. API 0066]
MEVAKASTEIAIRDSKNPHGPRHSFNHSTFQSLTKAIKSGQYDL